LFLTIFVVFSVHIEALEKLEDFVGTWALESIEGRNESGEWVPLHERFGADPVGYVMYDSGGRMAVQIMRRDRPLFSVDNKQEVPPEEAKDALIGYTAYFGTFSVDENEKSVTHHRIGHIIPNRAAVDAKRFYHFHGDRLTLTLPSGDVRFNWKRLP
jgi:hypothetical protein